MFDLEERLLSVEQTLQRLVNGTSIRQQGPTQSSPEQPRPTFISQSQPTAGAGADADRAVVFATKGETGFFGVLTTRSCVSILDVVQALRRTSHS